MNVLGPPSSKKLEAANDVIGLIGALAGPDPRRRQEAAMALGRLGDARAGNALIEALTDESMRDVAAISLLANAPGVMDSLVLTLRGANPFARAASADPDARAMVATILGQTNDPRVVEPLIAALEDVKVVGDAAVAALGRLRDPRAIEPLRNSLSRYGVAGIEALAEFDDPWALDVVIEWAMPQGQVRGDVNEAAAAIRALGKLGPPEEVRPIIAKISRHFPGPGTPNGDVIEEAVLDAQTSMGMVRVSD